jgi:hypothetical protein
MTVVAALAGAPRLWRILRNRANPVVRGLGLFVQNPMGPTPLPDGCGSVAAFAGAPRLWRILRNRANPVVLGLALFVQNPMGLTPLPDGRGSVAGSAGAPRLSPDFAKQSQSFCAGIGFVCAKPDGAPDSRVIQFSKICGTEPLARMSLRPVGILRNRANPHANQHHSLTVVDL